VCSFLLHIVYFIGFISRFYCVVFIILCVCVYVCVWATLPDLNKMEWNLKINVYVARALLSDTPCGTGL